MFDTILEKCFDNENRGEFEIKLIDDLKDDYKIVKVDLKLIFNLYAALMYEFTFLD